MSAVVGLWEGLLLLLLLVVLLHPAVQLLAAASSSAFADPFGARCLHKFSLQHPCVPQRNITDHPTSATDSTIKLVGGRLLGRNGHATVRIDSFSLHGVPRREGGDTYLVGVYGPPASGLFISAWMVDHANGTYSAMFRVPTSGAYTVVARLLFSDCRSFADHVSNLHAKLDGSILRPQKGPGAVLNSSALDSSGGVGGGAISLLLDLVVGVQDPEQADRLFCCHDNGYWEGVRWMPPHDPRCRDSVWSASHREDIRWRYLESIRLLRRLQRHFPEGGPGLGPAPPELPPPIRVGPGVSNISEWALGASVTAWPPGRCGGARWCKKMLAPEKRFVPHHSWGLLDEAEQRKWKKLKCQSDLLYATACDAASHLPRPRKILLMGGDSTTAQVLVFLNHGYFDPLWLKMQGFGSHIDTCWGSLRVAGLRSVMWPPHVALEKAALPPFSNSGECPWLFINAGLHYAKGSSLAEYKAYIDSLAKTVSTHPCRDSIVWRSSVSVHDLAYTEDHTPGKGLATLTAGRITIMNAYAAGVFSAIGVSIMDDEMLTVS